jgi:hypothetical protein
MLQEIIDRPYFKIYKVKNSKKCVLKLSNPNEILIRSFSYFLPDATSNSQMTTITFEADHIMLIKDHPIFTYISILKLIKSLTRQLNVLANYNYSFSQYDIDNIIVINNNEYLYISKEHLVPYDSTTNNISISLPFKKTNLSSPELRQLQTLPSEGQVTIKTIYYSLAALILQLLFKVSLSGAAVAADDNIMDILMPIKETKLYWFLLRGLKNDPKERYLLFC